MPFSGRRDLTAIMNVYFISTLVSRAPPAPTSVVHIPQARARNSGDVAQAFLADGGPSQRAGLKHRAQVPLDGRPVCQRATGVLITDKLRFGWTATAAFEGLSGRRPVRVNRCHTANRHGRFAGHSP